MKTGSHPLKVRLPLFFEWGVHFEEAYSVPEMAARKVEYANRQEVEQAIINRYPQTVCAQESEWNEIQVDSAKTEQQKRKKAASPMPVSKKTTTVKTD